MTNSRALIKEVRTRLSSAADPERAKGTQAYMKSKMPYYGVMSAGQRAIYRDVFKRLPLDSFEEWRDTALTLWRKAQFREERYAAIELTGWRAYRDYQTLDALGVYEEMIVDGAWWDYVDAVAIHRVGEYLLTGYPGPMKKTLRAWSRSDDMWKRRSAIISQVTLKDRTDLKFLYGCIERNADDKEFFIRKAIGWALRAYAWVDPYEIERYVDDIGDRLSGLSRREALKNVDRLKAKT